MSEREPWYDRCYVPNFYVGLMVFVALALGFTFGTAAGYEKARKQATKAEQRDTLTRIERRLEALEKR